MLKQELRLRYQEKRKKTSSEDVTEASLKISNKLLELPIWEFEYYHIFLHSEAKKEVDTSFIITLLQGKDKEIVVPKMDNYGGLQHFLLTDSTILKPNKWTIPEPVDGLEVPLNKIDVVFVPLLTFDTSGYRVGYGKGYYDSFLEHCKSGTLKIGVSIFEPVEQISNREPHDVRMDYCVTPSAIYSF